MERAVDVVVSPDRLEPAIAGSAGCASSARRPMEPGCSPAQLAADERGATLVESTFVIPFLLLFLFLAFWIVIVIFNALTIEFVLARVARDIASIGTTTTSVGSNPGDRVGAIKNEVQYRAGQFGVSLNLGDIWVCPAGATDKTAPQPCATESAGLPNDMITITVKKSVNVAFFEVPSFSVGSSVLVRNEPFR